jgi:hypothetical protein
LLKPRLKHSVKRKLLLNGWLSALLIYWTFDLYFHLCSVHRLEYKSWKRQPRVLSDLIKNHFEWKPNYFRPCSLFYSEPFLNFRFNFENSGIFYLQKALISVKLKFIRSYLKFSWKCDKENKNEGLKIFLVLTLKKNI